VIFEIVRFSYNHTHIQPYKEMNEWMNDCMDEGVRTLVEYQIRFSLRYVAMNCCPNNMRIWEKVIIRLLHKTPF